MCLFWLLGISTAPSADVVVGAECPSGAAGWIQFTISVRQQFHQSEYTWLATTNSIILPPFHLLISLEVTVTRFKGLTTTNTSATGFSLSPAPYLQHINAKWIGSEQMDKLGLTHCLFWPQFRPSGPILMLTPFVHLPLLQTSSCPLIASLSVLAASHLPLLSLHFLTPSFLSSLSSQTSLRVESIMSFHYFTSLPPEVRQQIWLLALDERMGILHIRPYWAAAHEVNHLNGEDNFFENDPLIAQGLANAENSLDEADHWHEEDRPDNEVNADEENGSKKED